MADQSLVLRSNIPPRQLALGDSYQERPSASGTGDDIPFLAKAPCLAPEGDQLRNVGLPAEIVETILSARAPSTRKISAATKQTMSQWVRDAVALAYEERSQALPLIVRAHFTRRVASSRAFYPCCKYVMWQAGPLHTRLSNFIVLSLTLFRAHKSFC